MRLWMLLPNFRGRSAGIGSAASCRTRGVFAAIARIPRVSVASDPKAVRWTSEKSHDLRHGCRARRRSARGQVFRDTLEAKAKRVPCYLIFRRTDRNSPTRRMRQPPREVKLSLSSVLGGSGCLVLAAPARTAPPPVPYPATSNRSHHDSIESWVDGLRRRPAPRSRPVHDHAADLHRIRIGSATRVGLRRSTMRARNAPWFPRVP